MGLLHATALCVMNNHEMENQSKTTKEVEAVTWEGWVVLVVGHCRKTAFSPCWRVSSGYGWDWRIPHLEQRNGWDPSPGTGAEERGRRVASPSWWLISVAGEWYRLIYLWYWFIWVYRSRNKVFWCVWHAILSLHPLLKTQTELSSPLPF